MKGSSQPQGQWRAASVAFVCEECERPVYARIDGARESITCEKCGHRQALRCVSDVQPGWPIRHCLRCGLDQLYVQKDFNRKIGLGVFAVAAMLSVPTWGLSLLAADADLAPDRDGQQLELSRL